MSYNVGCPSPKFFLDLPLVQYTIHVTLACYFLTAFIGTVNVVKKSNLLVAVERMLYQDLPGQKGQLKIFLSDPPLPNTQTCCKRMTVNSTYIFAGNYKINNNRVKLITNGCRTVYRLSGMDNGTFDVQNVDHSFLEQCQFRILASNS